MSGLNHTLARCCHWCGFRWVGPARCPSCANRAATLRTRSTQPAGSEPSIGPGLAAVVLVLLALFALAFFVSCSSAPPLEVQPTFPALPALPGQEAAQPGAPRAAAAGVLPPHAVPGAWTVVGQCVDRSTGAPLQLATDADLLAKPDGSGYVAFIHETIGGRDLITYRETTDCLAWSPPTIVVRPGAAGTPTAGGMETPSVAPPTAAFPLWSMLGNADRIGPWGVESHLWLALAREPNIAGAPSTWGGWRGPWLGTGAGNAVEIVYGASHWWELPTSKTTLMGGADEPTHRVLGSTMVALFAGHSYSGSEGPRIGLLLSSVPWNGRSWIANPDPVLSAPPPSWASQPEWVQDPRGGDHLFFSRPTAPPSSNEELRHSFSAVGLVGGWQPDDLVLRPEPGTVYSQRVWGAGAILEPWASSSTGWRWRVLASVRDTDQPNSRWFMILLEAEA